MCGVRRVQRALPFSTRDEADGLADSISLCLSRKKRKEAEVMKRGRPLSLFKRTKRGKITKRVIEHYLRGTVQGGRWSRHLHARTRAHLHPAHKMCAKNMILADTRCHFQHDTKGSLLCADLLYSHTRGAESHY